MRELRESNQEVLLLDAGDILQGQPTAYYYNYIDTAGMHPFASFFNQYNYDAITMGNHDIETGHAVYDKFVAQLEMPALAANVVRWESGEPYFQPYVIIKKWIPPYCRDWHHYTSCDGHSPRASLERYAVYGSGGDDASVCQ